MLRGYPAGPLDEAVDPDGQVRPGYVDVVAALDGVGIDGLRAVAALSVSEPLVVKVTLPDPKVRPKSVSVTDGSVMVRMLPRLIVPT